jgi:argininosuccinate synthase
MCVVYFYNIKNYVLSSCIPHNNINSDTYNQKDAEGFIKLNALRLRIANRG